METTQVKMEARAVQRYLRRSPRKVRLVADYVRGMNVRMALDKLKFTNHAAALDVSKVITSAAANLKDRFQDELIEDENLKIKTITVDEGPTLKRIQPAPQGRAHPIRKRSCHITVVVTAASKDNEQSEEN
jgi:large subunit ribosomal protein L22